MSNGTRKKKVDFKKLLIIEDEPNNHFLKKSTKSVNRPQNFPNKKEKSLKYSQKQKENKEKMSEKSLPRRIKMKNLKATGQITISEFSHRLKGFKEEINFLNKKRKAEINIEKIVNLQKNNANKINGAISNENKSNIKTKENNFNDLENKNSNEDKSDSNKNMQRIENQNQSSALIIDFHKLYLHLFESNRLDNSKPYKFVDYLITGDNLLFNIKRDKTKYEEIKKGIYIKSKNNNFLINDHLVNKFTYEYLKCNFSHSIMKKLCEKINIFLMNKKKSSGDKDTLSFEKKDKFTYSNFLADKLKDNTNKSILSFTNDTEYFKSLIYVCNKYSKYIGKKEMPEKILFESLDKNKKILEKFKVEGEAKNLAMNEEKEYLRDLLRSKKIRKYINKKFKIFDEEMIKTNKILNALDLNIFYKILEIIIKNKSDDDIDRLYKIFQEELMLPNNKKLEKNELKNFLIEFRFLLEIEIAKRKYNNNENNINDISIMKKIYEQINEYISINKEKYAEEENYSGKKGKIRNRIKLKSKKETNFVDKENDSMFSDIKNGDLSNDMSIELNETNIQNKINNENKNDYKSKIIPFKIPFPKNNLNSNINMNNNPLNMTSKNNIPTINLNQNANIKTSLFEINTIDDNNSCENNNNNISTKNIYRNFNVTQTNTHFETEKLENGKHKSRRRKKRENKKLMDDESNDNININGEGKNKNLFNNCITFNAINSLILKEKGKTDIGKSLLNKLYLGQDIFKLIIEKPKVKNIKDNDIINTREQKENINIRETTKDIFRKDNETRENSSKSNSKNEKIEKMELIDNSNALSNPHSPINKDKKLDMINNSNNSITFIKDKKQSITTNYIFSKHKTKNRNKIPDNTRNIDTIKFDNISNNEFDGDNIQEITRNNLIHSPNIGVKITRKSNSENFHNNINSRNKFLFSENKFEQIQNEKGKINNINIQIDRHSVEIKGGNIILI